MRRLNLLLRSELKLTRTSIPVHVIAIFQPALMFFLMNVILVFPTFDMNIVKPDTAEGQLLLAAMEEVRSPNVPYIRPILVDDDMDTASEAQIITVETHDGQPTATQHFNLIDSNMVKNFRNRLTASALVLWNHELGDQAVTIIEHPWLPEETSYAVFFGMAMLPLTVFLAAVMTGGYSTAQDFEHDTIREYQLAPANTGLILAARLTRLIIVGLLSASVLLTMLKLLTGKWPDSLLAALAILLPIAIVGGSLGITVGLLLQKTLPAFVIGLTSSFATWILGGAFGLSAGFNPAYYIVSRFMPNSYAVELLFPLFYGPPIGSPPVSILALVGFSILMLVIVLRVYRLRIATSQG
jgi:ABC-2 type transport system permease protein